MTALITFLAILFGLLSAFSILYISKDAEMNQLDREYRNQESNSYSQDQKTYAVSKTHQVETTARLIYSLREFISAIIVLIYITSLIIFVVIYLDISYLGFKFYPNNYFLLEDNLKIEIVELVAFGLITLMIVIIIPILLYKNISLRKELFENILFKIWYKEMSHERNKEKISYKAKSPLYSVLESPKNLDKSKHGKK